MLPLILAGAALAGLAALAVKMSRSVRTPPPMPEPALRTLADWRRDRESALDAHARTFWAECACCGAPTYDPRGGCTLCGWEGEPLEESRANLARYGSVDTPEQMAEWGELPPTPEERGLIRRILDLCAGAPRGQSPDAGFWAELDRLETTLAELREQRLRAAQQAARQQARD